ncbi:maleylpyruvate isomerase N-terminal domain-containing protein [Actinomycetospora flava]|uniref:Maleylpyruvate isomerase N-terminal domain-containing protein n=1 Tax=Actinomycetospora flava TaxID=3129232 RepID=A0ABU8LY89_9PSEU
MDEIAEWSRAQQRVIALVTGVSADRAETTVPACPDWTVRDLLSHMVGLGADVLAGDEPDDHNEEWTARQVDARRGRDVGALVAEWEVVAEPLRTWMAEHGTRPLGDVTIHEQDLRGALEEPGGRDTPAMAALRDRFVGRFAPRLDPGLPPIALVGEQWSWCSDGEPADAAVEVRASDFDLARALMARRSASQLRAWTVRGDVEPYLAAFATLGPLPDEDLTDG